MVEANALHKYGILVEYTHPLGAQAVNAVETSAITRFGADECFQIDKIEIFPPYTPAPANEIENILVELIIDGTSVDCIFLDSRMGTPYAIGTPPFKPSCYLFGDRSSVDPFLNFCLKGKTSLQIRTMGLLGGVAATSTYYIRVSGDWFKTNDALVSHFGPVFNPEPVTILDTVRDRRVTVSRPLPINLANWTNLSGGCPRAAKPRVIPWINFARNVRATTPNTEYPLDITPANVQYAWENMHWELDNKTYIVNDYVGIWPDELGQHLRTVWWEYGREEYPQPFVAPVRWDTRFDFNELPLGMPAHTGILSFHGPKPVDRKLLGTNEIVEARILDDGTAVNPNRLDCVLFAQWSRKIEF